MQKDRFAPGSTSFSLSHNLLGVASFLGRVARHVGGYTASSEPTQSKAQSLPNPWNIEQASVMDTNENPVTAIKNLVAFSPDRRQDPAVVAVWYKDTTGRLTTLQTDK